MLFHSLSLVHTFFFSFSFVLTSFGCYIYVSFEHSNAKQCLWTFLYCTKFVRRMKYVRMQCIHVLSRRSLIFHLPLQCFVRMYIYIKLITFSSVNINSITQFHIPFHFIFTISHALKWLAFSIYFYKENHYHSNCGWHL